MNAIFGPEFARSRRGLISGQGEGGTEGEWVSERGMKGGWVREGRWVGEREVRREGGWVSG